MGLARLERNPQRLVRTQQMLLADYFVDIAGAQSLSGTLARVSSNMAFCG
jgi:hypothetical protein